MRRKWISSWVPQDHGRDGQCHFGSFASLDLGGDDADEMMQ